MQRVKISSNPNQWLEFSDSVSKEEVAIRVAKYKKHLQDQEDEYNKRFESWRLTFCTRKSHTYKPNGHEIREFAIDTKLNGKFY